jgi:carbamoyl-phosphate synthase large subunit
MKPAISVLITGAGAPGIAGTVFALRHNPDGRKIKIVGVDIKTECVGQYFCDVVCKVPTPQNKLEFVEAIMDVCRSNEVQLIIPQVTKELAVFAEYQDVFHKHGIDVLVSPSAAIEIANNKFKIMEYARQSDVPVGQFWLARNRSEILEAVAHLGYPKKNGVVKLPISNGSRGVRILTEAVNKLDAFLNEKPSGMSITLNDFLSYYDEKVIPEILVMEYLPGRELTVDSYGGQQTADAVVRTRDRIVNGISFQGTVINHPVLESACKSLTIGLGLRYAHGFQFKEDEDGNPKLLECNPRIQGTMAASCLIGQNFIYKGICEALGEAYIQSMNSGESATVFYRYWGLILGYQKI